MEAVADQTLVDLAKEQCRASHRKICGQVLYVPILEAPGQTGVGRFGWKNQQASLLSFAADAYLNEMGITSRLQPDEVTNLCNTAAEPNDKLGADGLSDIDRFARFVRATKAPARDSQLAATPAAKHKRKHKRRLTHVDGDAIGTRYGAVQVRVVFRGRRIVDVKALQERSRSRRRWGPLPSTPTGTS